MAFGVPVQSLRLREDARPEWDAISGDVLAGNNASTAEVSFHQEFNIEFAPAAPPANSAQS